MKKFAIVVMLAFFLQGCDVLLQILEQVPTEVAPTTEEIVQGLKKALTMGTNYAATNLHKTDGYYKNKVVKIPLPKEVNNVLQTAMQNKTVKTLGLDKVLQSKTEKFVLSINRAAEEAAIEAKPIFINAVSGLTISQGMDILKGKDLSNHVSGFDSIAATHYLQMKTRPQLFNLFKPKMNAILDKDLGLGFSANQAWNELLKYYNGYVAPVLRKPTIDYTLSDYATNKALDGMFYMVGQQEIQIRRDPYKWSSDIIKKVFGYVTEN